MATPDEVDASLTNLQATADKVRTKASDSACGATPEDLDRLQGDVDCCTALLTTWLDGSLAPAPASRKK